jgi:PQQ-dependent catabolism-associated CXXCW motif protein
LWVLVLGFSWARAEVPEPQDYWTGEPKGEVPSSLSGGRVLDLAALREELKGNAVLIDVSRAQHRPETLPKGTLWLPTPHKAIPASHWWPGAGEGQLSPAQESAFRLQLESLTHADKSTPVIFYCHEHCWLSWNAAKRTIGYGYSHVDWYPDGIEGWTRANLPTETVSSETSIAGAP